MTVFLKIISIVIFIASIAIPIAINAYRDEYGDGSKEVGRGVTITGVIAAIIVFVLSCSMVIIPTGYTGVRTTFGQIDSVTVQNGFNWKIPFVQSIEQVNNKQQDINFSGQVWSETEQRTAIYYENITVTYQINSEKSAWIYANVSNYKDALINPNIVASSVKASSKELSDSDATNRSIIEPLCMANLQKSLDNKYGENVVIINKVIINNADFEDSYNKAIANKQQAQLEAEKQAIDNQKAVEKAEADAIVTKTRASAEAEAKVIQAEAEAEANELLQRSLTEQILNEMYIEKWNGELPLYVSGNNDSIMLGINTPETSNNIDE